MASLLNRVHAALYSAPFAWWSRWRPPRAAPLHLGNGRRVLAFSCAGIGDTLTDSVVFRALKETWPELHVAAVVHHRRRTLADHNPFVDQVFTFRKGPWPFWRLHRELQAAGPWDAILQLRGNDPEPRCQSFLLGPEVTVSTPDMTSLSRLCGHCVEQPDWDDTHGVEQTLRLARYLGAETTQPHLVYEVRKEEAQAMEEKLLGFSVGPGPRMVLQVGGGRRASWRDWPSKHWAALALAFDSLMKKQRPDATLPHEIILLGGGDQTERGIEISAYLDGLGVRHHNLVGALSLTESAAVLASCRTLVSTDTGIMHLGFAVGARVVALIHCNNPSHRVGPYGYGDRHRVVQLPRPAGYRAPADASMENIRPKDVMPAVMELWGGR
jgi:ADP-heptose:LPS heptosyltransferase